MTLRVNSLGVNTQSNSDSAATLISNRALVDLNETGIVTSGGSVTRWNNSANRNQSCYFNGTNAYVSTPDSGALALTGDVQTWTFYGVAAADFTPGAPNTLASQYAATGSQRSWAVFIDNTPSGGLQFYVSFDGAAVTIVDSTVLTGFTDGELYDVKVTRVASTGVVTFYTCVAGGSFVQLGDPVTAATGLPFNGTAPLVVGAMNTLGTPANLFNGTIQRFTLEDSAIIGTEYLPENEMLSESARTINLTDWAESGTGSITDNGDGTVTVDDQDTLADKYYVNKATTIADNSASYRYSVRLAQGTATQSAIRLALTGGTTSNNVVEYTWATGAISLSGTSPTNPQAVDNGDGTVTLSLTAVNNATGNTSALARVYAAGLAAGVTGSVIVHGEVSLIKQTNILDSRLAASWDARLQDDYNSSTLESVGPELYDYANVGLVGTSTGTLSQTATGFLYTHDGDPTASTDRVYVNVTTTIGTIYRVTRTVDGIDGGTLSQFVRNGVDGSGTILSTTSVDGSITFTATTTTTSILYDDSPNGSYSVEVSIKAVATYTSTNAIYRDPYDLDVVLGTGANLIKHESGAAAFNGVSGSYISAPDSPAASVTGDCILYGYVQPVDNTPAVNYGVVSKWVLTGNQRSYFLQVAAIAAGDLRIGLSSDGTAEEVVTSTTPTPYADGVGYWAIAVIDLGTDITFYTSTAAPTATFETAFSAATQLGSPVAITTATIYDSTTPPEVGSIISGTNSRFNGQIHRAGIINGILPQGLEFGEELVTNTGGPFTSLDGYVVVGDASAEIIDGAIRFSGTAATSSKCNLNIPMTGVEVGIEYVATIELGDNSNSGTKYLQYDDGSPNIGAALNGNAANTITFTAVEAGTLQLKSFMDENGYWDVVSVTIKPTAAIAVDFNPSLAGRSANGVDGDTFFGAEMLKPSARVINATDWSRAGTGTITNNGDGTVTLDDVDDDLNQTVWFVTSTGTPVTSGSNKMSIKLSAGTAANTAVLVRYTGAGNLTPYDSILIDWTDPANPTTNNSTVEVTTLGDGVYQYDMVTTEDGSGATGVQPQIYPAGEAALAQGSVIVHGDVSLQSQWTMAGGTAIQNSGTAEVRSWGGAGIETTVAPALIPTPMTMFMVGKADLLGTGAFFTARDDASAGPYVALVGSNSRFDAGGTFIERPIDTSPHLHTARHNGDATTSYQVDSGTPIVGNAGAEEMQFGTLFTSASGTSSYLTGSIGRYILFDEELNDSEVEFAQTLLLPN